MRGSWRVGEKAEYNKTLEYSVVKYCKDFKVFIPLPRGFIIQKFSILVT